MTVRAPSDREHSGGGNRKGTKAGWGATRKLPSKRWQARYRGPDGREYTARTDDDRSLTFEAKRDAEAWLGRTRTAIDAGSWIAPGTAVEPEALPIKLGEYATAWLSTRALAVRTREHYGYLLDNHIRPTFGDVELAVITPASVRLWHARPNAKPTARAHSYGLLRSILATAAGDGLVISNPCMIRGAGSAKTTKRIRPMTLDELAALVAALPERYRMLAQLACWCSLRFGELAGLQRSDIDLDKRLLHVRRAVVRTKDGLVEKGPKTTAGLRTVTIPGHVIADLREHLETHAEPGRAGWVFPGRAGGPLAASTLQRVFGPAAEKAGRPDVTPHVLRHTGQTLAALSGANLRELMVRAGQSSPSAALRYLHEADGRQREIADRLEQLAANNNVVPISSAPAGPPRRRRTTNAGRGSGQSLPDGS